VNQTGFGNSACILLIDFNNIIGGGKGNMTNSVNYIKGYTYLRVISCIAIIFIHAIVSALTLFGGDFSLKQIVFYRSIVNCLMWAVPCFIMVTGALLLDPSKQISYQKLFSKYIIRILKVIIIFGVIFTVLETIFDPDKANVKEFLNGLYEIFAGQSWAHMWYLYCLIGLYLLIPFYKKITEHSTKNELKYLLIIYFVFLSIIPVLNAWGIESGFYIHVSSIYPFWLFLGYYLIHYTDRAGRRAAVLVLAGLILMVICTWIRWNHNVEWLDRLFSYSSVLVVFQGGGLFQLLSGRKLSRFSSLDRLLERIDSRSFGIYLIHLIYIRGIYKYLHFNPFEYGGILGIIGIVIAVFALSYATDYMLKKIPVFRSIL